MGSSDGARVVGSETLLTWNEITSKTYGMNFKDLIESHPEIVLDRHSLSLSAQSRPTEIADAFSRFGVVMLKDALPPAVLERCAEAFRRFVQSLGTEQGMAAGEKRRPQRENTEAYAASWHSPWMVRHEDRFPAAVIMSAVIRSWIWDIVEEICSSSHIAILLKWCTARHSVDQSLGVGAHQDAKVVAAEAPFSIWIPFHDITPPANSGLGFVVPSPDRLLPTLPHDDVGPDYVLSDLAKLWIPHYAAGDLTIHSKFSPHFTTGYGTLSDRFSLEIRAMSRSTAPEKYLDPAMYVSRRNGIPTIVEVRGSPELGVQGFFDSADLSTATSKELRKVI